jgi:hypothetical protein
MSSDLLDFSEVFKTFQWNPDQDQTVWRVLFLFYVAVAGNYIGGLFNKKVVEYFEKDLLTMHLLGFLIMMVTIGKNTIVESFKYTAMFYLVFEISTRMHYKLMFLFLGILAAEYFVENRLKILDEQIKTGNAGEEELDEFRKQKVASEWLIKISIAIVVIGVVHAAYEFSLHHDDFNLKDFILDSYEFQHEKA